MFPSCKFPGMCRFKKGRYLGISVIGVLFVWLFMLYIICISLPLSPTHKSNSKRKTNQGHTYLPNPFSQRERSTFFFIMRRILQQKTTATTATTMMTTTQFFVQPSASCCANHLIFFSSPTTSKQKRPKMRRLTNPTNNKNSSN